MRIENSVGDDVAHPIGVSLGHELRVSVPRRPLLVYLHEDSSRNGWQGRHIVVGLGRAAKMREPDEERC
ncbi:hypothetical protein PRIPAC_88919 [Pristionchus pacificus]|uniref:Uncharacterized protein n=1 Tax=Pristionchus pacificus TaxID=54126 RepID=A0A2A6CWP8_PRIPA|nr:hypothetical protein PRIPAC_88919 [Pristionchus pacificus]|eukprot:PDM82664.1 hypothetical protein PRIPAC_37057 [Pristionchus pacificus]